MVLQAKRVLTAKKVKALSFDGVNDYVSVPDSAALQVTSEATFVVIFKVTEQINDGILISKAADIYGHEGYQMSIHENSEYLRFRAEIGGSTINWLTYTGNLIGKWHIYAVTFDGSTLKKYLDGVLVNELSKAGTIATSTYPLFIGKQTIHYKGYILCVIIYNKTLSDDEIKQLAKNPYHPPLSGCVLWLSPESIDENAGVWYDKSGNNLNGTIYGAQAIEMNKLAFSVKSPSRVLGVV